MALALLTAWAAGYLTGWAYERGRAHREHLRATLDRALADLSEGGIRGPANPPSPPPSPTQVPVMKLKNSVEQATENRTAVAEQEHGRREQ